MTDYDDAYELGWIASAAVSAAHDLHRGLASKSQVTGDLVAAIDACLERRPADGIMAAVAGRLPAGFSVVDARGECYAIRESREAARRAVVDAEQYLDGAATCGHPAAGRWVDVRLPFSIEPITRTQRAEILEDGTPVLDRESTEGA